MGLDGQQQALPQLLEIIALGEAHLLTIAPS
jgi:hypothetical protein